MPFKSKAQRRKFAELLLNGDITEEAYEEWNRSTGSAKLPERLHPKPRRKAKKAKASRARKAAGRKTKAGSKKGTRARTKATKAKKAKRKRGKA